MKNESIRLTFDDAELVWPEPDASRLPAFRRFDADPAIDAEIAVERGVATPEEEEYVEELRGAKPIPVRTGVGIEVEIPAGQSASGYFEEGGQLLGNEDEGGGLTLIYSAVPDPREEQADA